MVALCRFFLLFSRLIRNLLLSVGILVRIHFFVFFILFVNFLGRRLLGWVVGVQLECLSEFLQPILLPEHDDSIVQRSQQCQRWHGQRQRGDGCDRAVMDAIAPSQSAKADLSDGVLNYSVDAYFDAKGEVFSPLLITEFQASIPNQGMQWVEIANTSALSIRPGRLQDRRCRQAAAWQQRGHVRVPHQDSGAWCDCGSGCQFF